MTNEQAIKELQESHDIVRNHDIDESESYLMQALNMAIKALQTQADGEYILKSEAIRVASGYCHPSNIAKELEKLPSVDIPSAEPKTGHWVGIDEEPHEVWECDHCGFVIDGSGCIDPYDYRDTYKFCPNCGARMVELQERSE